LKLRALNFKDKFLRKDDHRPKRNHQLFPREMPEAVEGVVGIIGTLIQDDRKAFEWYQKAADQGNAHAQFALGSLYVDEKKSFHSYKEAIKWLQKAGSCQKELCRGSFLKEVAFRCCLRLYVTPTVPRTIRNTFSKI